MIKISENRTAPLQTDVTGPSATQITKVEARLANTEELIDLYVKHSFETQTQLAEQKEEIERSKKEIQTLITRDQEDLIKLQSLEKAHFQLKAKEEEIAGLEVKVESLIAELQTLESSSAYKGKDTETLQA